MSLNVYFFGYCFLKAVHQSKNLAFKYSVGQSTIYDIFKAEEKIKIKVENPYSYMKSTFKESNYQALDKALKVWLYKARAKNMHFNTFNNLIKTNNKKYTKKNFKFALLLLVN